MKIRRDQIAIKLASVLVTVALVSLLTAVRLSARERQMAGKSDAAGFFSNTALLERAPGTPVGPPKKIIICHRTGNGESHTIRVNESAVPAHLAHGDSLGPCTGDEVVCRHGHTIITSDPQPGDTPGPCENQVFMCNLHLRVIVVNPNDIDGHLAKGHHLGLCPGKTLLCHKGHSIVVSDAAVPAHLAHGDTLGYCLGAQGPLITSLPD